MDVFQAHQQVQNIKKTFMGLVYTSNYGLFFKYFAYPGNIIYEKGLEFIDNDPYIVPTYE